MYVCMCVSTISKSDVQRTFVWVCVCVSHMYIYIYIHIYIYIYIYIRAYMCILLVSFFLFSSLSWCQSLQLWFYPLYYVGRWAVSPWFLLLSFFEAYFGIQKWPECQLCTSCIVVFYILAPSFLSKSFSPTSREPFVNAPLATLPMPTPLFQLIQDFLLFIILLIWQDIDYLVM